jgi:hypothetical protein
MIENGGIDLLIAWGSFWILLVCLAVLVLRRRVDVFDESSPITGSIDPGPSGVHDQQADGYLKHDHIDAASSAIESMRNHSASETG